MDECAQFHVQAINKVVDDHTQDHVKSLLSNIEKLVEISCVATYIILQAKSRYLKYILSLFSHNWVEIYIILKLKVIN